MKSLKERGLTSVFFLGGGGGGEGGITLPTFSKELKLNSPILIVVEQLTFERALD